MTDFNSHGLDDLLQELEQIQQTVEDLGEERSVTFEELFTRGFMVAHTNFSTIDELLEAGGFHADTNEEFEAIPEDALDEHIARTTSFSSWEEMLGQATEQYIFDQLEF